MSGEIDLFATSFQSIFSSPNPLSSSPFKCDLLKRICLFIAQINYLPAHRNFDKLTER